MTEKSRGYRRLIAGTAIAAALTMTIAAPAWADEADPAEAAACWVEAETSTTHCYADADELQEAVIDLYGSLPLEEGSAAARQALRGGTLAAAASSFTIARLYPDASYGGAYLPVYSSSSTFCADGGLVADSSMSAPWNNSVSSVRAYWGCEISLWTNTGYTGTSGTYVNGASLGALNNASSSYKVQD